MIGFSRADVTLLTLNAARLILQMVLFDFPAFDKYISDDCGTYWRVGRKPYAGNPSV